ncbi:hypothetical protein FC83_GL001270 [Agrilactobacillus composti DSM 18527 = JCM 14202]|uniref:Competence protein ComGF n=2 Tax=Agrilactobacillus TaxID=2767875 RepID=A0A0R1Y668_9LACO|nr:hypothetical protein FC83_GL001270 [Agrilactobacillus composti DSM 18527 = JCM 14202]
MIVSLLIFALVIFLFSQIPTLIQDSQRAVFKVSSETKMSQAILQLDHYLQKSIFRDIDGNDLDQRLIVIHRDQDGVYQTRNIRTNSDILQLQSISNEGYMPLLDGVNHVTFKRIGSYIDMKLTLENVAQPIHHRFYCPASKGGLKA